MQHPPRPGDWTCPGCNANVFANKANCFKCGGAKPGDGANQSAFPTSSSVTHTRPCSKQAAVGAATAGVAAGAATVAVAIVAATVAVAVAIAAEVRNSYVY